MAINQCQQNYKMSDKEIKVPNIGEFKEVEVIEVLVSDGQSLSKNDPLITIESDKSSVEIPSSVNGKIKSVKIKVGDKVSQGDLILTLEESIEEEKNIEKEAIKEVEPVINQKHEEKIEKVNPPQNLIKKDNSKLSSASPKVRKFARELGVNINEIAGSERQGRVVEDDIKNFISTKINKTPDKIETQPKKIVSEFSHSDFGEIEIKDMPRVKKLASTYLVNSWTTIPHVTNHDEADITEMEDFRVSLTDMYTGERKKITPLAFIIKALVSSLKKFPSFNSSIDDIENGKITIKKYFHVGIAVDTPHGLMVPKIRNADNNNISYISNELKIVSDQCRNLKIDKKELFKRFKKKGINLNNSSFKNDHSPLDENSEINIGRNYSKAYIHHLFKSNEILGMTILSIYNIWFMNNFLMQIRKSIHEKRFNIFKSVMLSNFN